MAAGNTQRLRYIQKPSVTAVLGQSLFWHAIEVPQGATQISNPAELSSKLQKIVRALSKESAVWFAFSTAFSVRLFTAEVEFDLSRDRGKPMMRLREYNDQGRVTNSDLWVRLSNDEWTRAGV